MIRKEWYMDQIKALRKKGYDVEIHSNFEWVRIRGSNLEGRGWTDDKGKPIKQFSSLIYLPSDFPYTYPSQGHTDSIHISPVYYNGQPLANTSVCQKHKPWLWMCFSNIVWDSQQDNLITVLQLIEGAVYQRRKMS